MGVVTFDYSTGRFDGKQKVGVARPAAGRQGRMEGKTVDRWGLTRNDQDASPGPRARQQWALSFRLAHAIISYAEICGAGLLDVRSREARKAPESVLTFHLWSRPAGRHPRDWLKLDLSLGGCRATSD
jgi:hypothetical protein